MVKLIESFLRINFSSSNIGGAASTFPIYGFFSGTAVTLENTVKISRAYVLSDTFQITEGLSGAWFNPATSGQGVYFEVLPAAGVIVMAWFTNDNADPDSGVPSAVGDASNRWLTASGTFQGNQFVGSDFKTGGGLFDNSQIVSTSQVGSVIIDFNNCSTAVMSYVLNDSNLANTINLQRVSGVNVDFCENLAIEQNPGVSAQ